MSNLPTPVPPTSVPPVVFDTPTLGRAVCLGELYDERSGKFLGVQLYSQSKIKEVETDIRNTELTVSLSTTHQQKATVLDIKAQLSLNILGGLVKVSGSASYLDDEKSNTNEYAYAMALKMRLKEKRILFAEPDLGHQILPVVTEDYINTKLATHFVSSIVYGGNYIVNLVAKQTEMSKEEKIEGKLQASFDKLKGAISLNGSVQADIGDQFKDMDAKFDLVVHGDVALDKVPVTPKDVLTTFPEAASLITDGGGVPISVTLQPIPPALYKGGLIFQIEDDVVDEILAAFANLDDLHSRFLVLQDKTKRLQAFIPELARTARIVATAYIEEHSKLLHELGKFLQQHKLGEEPKHDDMLAKVDRLYNTHLGLGVGGKKSDDEPKPKDPPVSAQYPSTLVGLEEELSRFQSLVTDIRNVRRSLMPKSDKGDKDEPVDDLFHLSSLEDICGAIRTQSEIPFFIMTPISGDENKHYDLLVLKYLAMVKKYSDRFTDLVNPAHMFYAENLQNLEDRLPNGGVFANLKAPSCFIGEVDENGELSWKLSPPPWVPVSSQTYDLAHSPFNGGFGRLSLALKDVNGKQSYTILFRAVDNDPGKERQKFIVLALQNSEDDTEYLTFRNGFGLEHIGGTKLGFTDKRPGKGETFTVAFVQDVAAKQWILYLNGDEIDRKGYGETKLLEKLQVGYPPVANWWDGSVSDFKTYSRALSKGQIQKVNIG